MRVRSHLPVAALRDALLAASRLTFPAGPFVTAPMEWASAADRSPEQSGAVTPVSRCEGSTAAAPTFRMSCQF